VRALQSDLNDIAGKLSARLEDNDRMRRQLRQAGDEIQALRYERDGLRSRLRATEANLTAALKGDAVQAINGEIQRRVESIMRVAPATKKGADE
jgi:predicted  nucleic acid-binding Zn-ribbon protein